MTKSQHFQAVQAAATAGGSPSTPGGRGGRRPALPKPKPSNAISNVRPIRNHTPASRRQATPVRAVTKPRASACPNTACDSPNVEDGICHSCGTVVTESNIVSEITFGENAAGGAVLQGTFVGDGKGHANTMGPNGNRLGGGSDGGGHVDAIREGTEVINGLKQAFSIDENAVQFGIQGFKMVTMRNFCQGRRISVVAACALYAAARAFKSEQNNPDWRNYQCKIMLIDIADHLGLNVFKLCSTFKLLLTKLGLFLPMIVPEDLMFRFANKLDFGVETKPVVLTASKLAQRMQQDWMLTGRRPAGICGACILMAARLHNFRRTVQEIVYIVKVTHTTIEKRLDEFKYTAASKMTVDEFLTNEPSATEHDPPSFYQQTEEYKKTRKTRKRKRDTHGLEYGDDEPERSDEEDSQDAGSERDSRFPSSNTPEPQSQIDADGFAIPALPARKKRRTKGTGLPTPESSQNVLEDPSMGGTPFSQDSNAGGPSGHKSLPPSQNVNMNPPASQHTNMSPPLTQGTQTSASAAANSTNDIPIDPSLLALDNPSELEDLTHLAKELGDVELPQPEPEAESTATGAAEEDPEFEADMEQTITSILNQPETRQYAEDVAASHLKAHLPPRGQIDPKINDPNSEVHKKHFEIAKFQADIVMQMIAVSAPKSFPNMDVAVVGEDEFIDDAEVLCCLLSPEEVAIKEKIWYNENKDWLVRQIEKEQKKREEENRPKVRRNRKKVDKIGAGQKAPMNSSHEAAIAALERRTGRVRNGEVKSKKINYKAIQEMMDREDGSVPSSSSTSRATSVVAPRRAGSAILAARAGSRAGSVVSVEYDSEYNGSDVGDTTDIARDPFARDEDEDDEVIYNDDDDESYGQGEDDLDLQ